MADFRKELAAKVAALPDVAKVYPWEPGSKTAPIPKSVSVPSVSPAVGGAAGRVIGAVAGAGAGLGAGILLNHTPAGAGSDKVPPPSARQIEEAVPRAKGGPVKAGGCPMKNVDNSGFKKESF